MQKKICTKSNKEAVRKYQRTEKGQERHRENQRLYRLHHPDRVRDIQKRCYEKHKEARSIMMQRYNDTINGYLRHIYGDIKRRIVNPFGKNKCYKNVKDLFKFSDKFVDYVINTLKIDPRGLQIHRIDNKKHYEPGNIEFLTAAEHREAHGKRG